MLFGPLAFTHGAQTLNRHLSIYPCLKAPGTSSKNTKMSICSTAQKPKFLSLRTAKKVKLWTTSRVETPVFSQIWPFPLQLWDRSRSVQMEWGKYGSNKKDLKVLYEAKGHQMKHFLYVLFRNFLQNSWIQSFSSQQIRRFIQFSSSFHPDLHSFSPVVSRSGQIWSSSGQF